MNRIPDLYQKYRRLASWLRPMQIPLHSARTCFFLVLSVFPSLLLLLGLLRYTSYGVDELLALLEGWLPHSLQGVVTALVDASYRHSSGMVVSVSALAALWSASKRHRPPGLLAPPLPQRGPHLSVAADAGADPGAECIRQRLAGFSADDHPAPGAGAGALAGPEGPSAATAANGPVYPDVRPAAGPT